MNYNNPVIFIDLSYYIFYRWFALYHWYKISQRKEPDIENIFNDDIFIEKYDKLFWETIKKFIKKHKIESPTIIFGKDCKRSEIWRHNIHTSYKVGRDDKLKNFNGKIFTHTYKHILPKIIKENPDVKLFSVDKAEADDIIGVLKAKIRRENDSLSIYIITNDHDYLQLLDDNTFIYNLKGYNLLNKSKGNVKTDLYLKIIRGDVSDNIKGIFDKNVSENKAMEYVNDPLKLEELLKSNKEVKKKFENNRKLIDFSYIPDELKKEIEKLI